MSAKEIAESCYCYATQKYVFDDDDLQEFIDQLCKEQRSACLEAYEDDWKSKSILTAPQPEGL